MNALTRFTATSKLARAIVQLVVVAALVAAWFLHEHSIDELRHEEAQSTDTAAAVQSILADACGSVDFATLKQQGLVAECRLARQGEMDSAVTHYLSTHKTPPSEVTGDLVPDTSEPAPVDPTGKIDGAVADWFASHNLSLTPGYTTSLQRAVTTALVKNPPKPGRPPTTAEIAAAVARRLTAHPPPKGDTGAAGRGISRAEVDSCDLVLTYTDGDTDRFGPICGTNGRDATPDQVAAAVGDYCATHDACRGPKGEQGDPGYPDSFSLDNGEVCTDPDGDHAYTCERAPLLPPPTDTP